MIRFISIYALCILFLLTYSLHATAETSNEDIPHWDYTGPAKAHNREDMYAHFNTGK